MYMYICRVPWLACRLVPGEDEVEVYSSILQYIAVYCNLLQCTHPFVYTQLPSRMQRISKQFKVCCSVLQRVAACSSVL